MRPSLFPHASQSLKSEQQNVYEQSEHYQVTQMQEISVGSSNIV